jgi:hypothetical protein
MIIFLCTMNSTLVKCSPPVARGSSLWILATGRLYNCGCVNIVINTLDVNSIRMTDIFMNDPSFVKYNLCKGWTAYIHTVIVFWRHLHWGGQFFLSYQRTDFIRSGNAVESGLIQFLCQNDQKWCSNASKTNGIILMSWHFCEYVTKKLE